MSLEDNLIFEDDAIIDDEPGDVSSSKNKLLVICAPTTKSTFTALEKALPTASIDFINHESSPEDYLKDCVVIVIECRLLEAFSDLILLRKIREKRPLVPVVLISKNDDPDFVVEAYSAGTTDYCLMDIAPEVLAAKIEVFAKMSQSARIIELQNQEVVESLKIQRQAFEQKLAAEKDKAHMAAEVEINRRTKEILDNLSEAFFTVENNLRLGRTTSAAAKEIFGKEIGELEIEEAFPFLNRDQAIFFRLAIEQVFDGFMPLNVSLDNIPKRLNTANDKIILFRFTPISDEQGNIIRLIGCGVDITFQVKRAAELEKKIDTNTALVTILEDPWVFVGFLHEVSMHLSDLASGKLSKTQILFVLHTLKGNLSAYSLKEISSAIHHMESDLKDLDNSPSAIVIAKGYAQKIRDMIVEFLTQFISILKINPKNFEVDYLPVSNFDINILRKHVAMVQEENIREKLDEWLILLEYVTFERLIAPIQLAAKQLAEKQNKKLCFKICGGNTKLDQKRFGGLLNSLIHAVRNSIDHGIESPDEREMAGKTKEGVITFSAEVLETNEFVIDIFDDGRGIDPNIILSAALEKKLITQKDKERFNDKKAFQLIFLEGFSTRGEVSEVSGRGVGVSSIKEEVRKLGGKIFFNAALGQGTRLRIVIPHFIQKNEDMPVHLILAA